MSLEDPTPPVSFIEKQFYNNVMETKTHVKNRLQAVNGSLLQIHNVNKNATNITDDIVTGLKNVVWDSEAQDRVDQLFKEVSSKSNQHRGQRKKVLDDIKNQFNSLDL